MLELQNEQIEISLKKKIILGIIFSIFCLIGMILSFIFFFGFNIDFTDYNNVLRTFILFYPLLLLPIACFLVPFAIYNYGAKITIFVLLALSFLLLFISTENRFNHIRVTTDKADVFLINR